MFFLISSLFRTLLVDTIRVYVPKKDMHQHCLLLALPVAIIQSSSHSAYGARARWTFSLPLRHIRPATVVANASLGRRRGRQRGCRSLLLGWKIGRFRDLIKQNDHVFYLSDYVTLEILVTVIHVIQFKTNPTY
jgi:hypothetical protein